MDYESIGFKCGIEIHQQLEGRKLFCSCPTINSDREPDIRLVRKLRAVAGETGEVDAAAQHEMKKDREFIYLGDSTDVCLVETDSEPPHEISPGALETALQMAKMLNMQVFDEIQAMRKTVIDGSNTSGFQRTMLIGADGFVESSKGKVRISVLCLEEESSQKIAEDDETVTYRLDRLGIPLLEIGTEPDIKSPEHAKEVAGIIGMMLRSTGKVKRGLGTIRQDVNLSVKGHGRVEIKGFQELKSIPKVIEKEVERELKEIKEGKKTAAHVRKAEDDLTTSYLRPMPGAARMYPETDIAPIRITKEMLAEIKAPELITEKAEGIEKKYGLHKDVASLVVKEGKQELLERMAAKLKNTKPSMIATVITSTMTEARRRYGADTDKLGNNEIEQVLGYLDKGELPKSALAEAIADCCKRTFDIAKYRGADDEALEKDIKEIAEKNKGAGFGALMGMVMKKHGGKVDGKKASEILKRHVKQ